MKDILIRAAKTFVQAAIAYVCAVPIVSLDANAGRALFVGAVAAGISAVMNLCLKAVETVDSNQGENNDENGK